MASGREEAGDEADDGNQEARAASWEEGRRLWRRSVQEEDEDEVMVVVVVVLLLLGTAEAVVACFNFSEMCPLSTS